MNVLFLKYAVEIAKAGSISKAAENLCVSQPNLSRAIKELEKELNIEIFERNAKGMSLTPDGEKLVSYGKKILEELDYIERTLKNGGQEKKLFSISVPRASYIGDAIAHFSLTLKKEDSIELLYEETNAAKTIKSVIDGSYRLGIIRYAATHDRYYKELLEEKGLVGEVITEFSYTLLMNKNNPMSELDEILYSDLENYIEISHADPYVPSQSIATARKEELPDNVKRRIFVFERASQYEILSINDETFMWVSPISKDILTRYNLIERKCVENTKVYKDILIHRKDYKLSKLDNLFISELCNAKRNIF